MALTSVLGGGKGLVRGDAGPYRFTVDMIGSGRTVTKAYFMVKPTYATADGSATISKTITTANSAGVGQIEDDGATDGSAILRFDLTNANTTAPTAETVYYWDVVAILDNAEAWTIDGGTAVWANEVVQAST